MQDDFDFLSWIEMSGEKAMAGYFVRATLDKRKPQYWRYYEELEGAVTSAEELADTTGNDREVVQILDTKFSQKVLATVAIDPETSCATTFFH